MKFRNVLAACVLAAVAAVPGASAKGNPKPGKLYPYDGYPELASWERTLTKVPFAEGAPAVVLLEAEQNRWEEVNRIRTDYFRRVKLLTDGGVADYADFSYELLGSWRVKKVSARTVLPDGTEVDASEGVFRPKSSDNDLQVVKIAFPRAEKGAILDLHITTEIDSPFVPPWIIQQEIPVMKSEFVMVPPIGLKFRKVLFSWDENKEETHKVRVADKNATFFTYQSVPPVPDVPNRPALEEIAAKLVIIVDSYKDELNYVALASDWKEFIKRDSDWASDWIKSRHSDATDLARNVVGDATAPLAKAEAIRKALREKVRVEYASNGCMRDGPDKLLAEGSGTTTDVALAAAAMLQAVGVKTTPIEYRRRSQGLIPPDFPIPSLLTDTLLRIDGGRQPVYFSPASDLPAGRLPWYAQGVLGVPLDGAGDKPVEIPDFPARDDRTERSTTATLSADGRISGETGTVFRGVAGERLRRALHDLDEDGRRAYVRDRMQAWIPGLQVTSLELRNLDDATLPFALKCGWEADGYVTAAGKRLLIDPFLFSRIRADDWPPTDRAVPVDLGAAYEVVDKLSLKLPDGVADVTVPEGRDLNAGPVGLYVTTLSAADGTLSAERHMRLDIYRFPTQSYTSLRRWFADIAASDESTVVVTLP